jgi:DUF1365 family protein
MISSCVYDAEVRHRRGAPEHVVRHSYVLALLDLDELPGVVRSRRWWSDRPAPVWFRRQDYLEGSDRPLRDALGDLVEERLGRRPAGPVRMLTQLRTLGWLFNPLTTYYCLTPDGERLDVLVLEVTNTPWHERSWYVLDGDDVSGRGTPFAKDHHVSPFLPMDLIYRCRAPIPGDRLALRLELSRSIPDGGSERVLDVDLTGERRALGEPATRRTAVRRALQTVGVSAAIHAHAAVLAAKGARFHGHPDRRGIRTTRDPLETSPTTNTSGANK